MKFDKWMESRPRQSDPIEAELRAAWNEAWIEAWNEESAAHADTIAQAKHQIADLGKELANAIDTAKAYDKRMMAAIRAHIDESEKNLIYRVKLERAGDIVESLKEEIVKLEENNNINQLKEK